MDLVRISSNTHMTRFATKFWTLLILGQIGLHQFQNLIPKSPLLTYMNPLQSMQSQLERERQKRAIEEEKVKAAVRAAEEAERERIRVEKRAAKERRREEAAVR